ncbi:MAG TPA: LLM class flavin-dependent oxidoreductase [Thermoanaerobaculia bacterium]|jgi:alkanesulfonate monooxygenase|nr:LLM class flavin-dependent oxidoreductase [Thermoanaerobaculia bacterium]
MPPLRFHWSLSSAGDKLRRSRARTVLSAVPNLDELTRFCEHAEACGFESLLTAFSFARPDPLTLAAALGMRTKHIKFMVAVRSGLHAPPLFVQQVNTVAAMTNGRICINVVGGHTPDEQKYYGDFLSHDERYARTDEFLTICRGLWRQEHPVTFEGTYYRVEESRINVPFVAPDRSAPEIFLGGNSEQAEALAIAHADCLWRMPEPVEQVAAAAARIRAHGKEVGLLTSIIARPTRAEALQAAHNLVAEVGVEARETHHRIEQRMDSVAFRKMYTEANASEWPAPYLWTGAVPYFGAPSIAIVGSVDEVAEALLAYKSVGVSQFLFLGWPDLEEMTIFSEQVLPRVRALEAEPVLQGDVA